MVVIEVILVLPEQHERERLRMVDMGIITLTRANSTRVQQSSLDKFRILRLFNHSAGLRASIQANMQSQKIEQVSMRQNGSARAVPV